MEKVIDKDELELVKKAIIDSGLYLASHEDLENMAKIILDTKTVSYSHEPPTQSQKLSKPKVIQAINRKIIKSIKKKDTISL